MGNEFNIELKGVEQALKMFDSKNVIYAARRAVEDAAKSAMTEIKRNITEEYNVKPGRLSQYLRLTTRPKGDNLEAVITGKGRGLALSYFDAKQEGQRIANIGFARRKGKVLLRKQGRKYGGQVTALVKKMGGRKIVSGEPKPFIVQMKSGHIAVVRRIGKERKPIRELFGPGIGGLFGTTKIMGDAKRIVNEKFGPRFKWWLNDYMPKRQ